MLLDFSKRLVLVKQPEQIVGFFQQATLELLPHDEARHVPRMLGQAVLNSRLGLRTVHEPGDLHRSVKEHLRL